MKIIHALTHLPHRKKVPGLNSIRAFLCGLCMFCMCFPAVDWRTIQVPCLYPMSAGIGSNTLHDPWWDKWVRSWMDICAIYILEGFTSFFFTSHYICHMGQGYYLARIAVFNSSVQRLRDWSLLFSLKIKSHDTPLGHIYLLLLQTFMTSCSKINLLDSDLQAMI